jgi:hypothetical protein
MRNNQRDLDHYFADLTDWTKDIEKKDKSTNLRATKKVNPDILPPVRNRVDIQEYV